MTKSLERKISLVITILAFFVSVSLWRGSLLMYMCSVVVAGYSLRRTFNLFHDQKDKRVGCDQEDIGIEGPFPVSCPCGCENGLLRSDGRNTQGTLTFLMCDVCSCTYEADDMKPREIKSRSKV